MTPVHHRLPGFLRCIDHQLQRLVPGLVKRLQRRLLLLQRRSRRYHHVHNHPQVRRVHQHSAALLLRRQNVRLPRRHRVGLTIHVRLLHGEDTKHVLDAVAKAFGLALAQACSTRPPP